MTALRSIFILVICVGLIVGFLRYQENTGLANTTPETNQTEMPEFFLDESLTMQYRTDGSLDYQFNTEHIDYFKKANTTEAKMAYFIFYNKDGHTWHTRADRATLLNGNKKIQLKGGVRVWQPARHLELTTEEFSFTESRQYAETEKPVTITSTVGVTHSTGLNVDLIEEKLQLLSAVTGSYHVKK